ncbi:MAG: helix-turn-helix domain-containing protein [bacterium]|nr:helix-turn-helix domain-containing protein [bacterium]
MEDTSPTANFFEDLRKAREFRGLSLESICRTTRIPLDYLKALECGQLEVIPAPIRRGVIAAYAKASGMNGDKVLKSLEELSGHAVGPVAGNLSIERPKRETMTVGMTRAQIRTAWFAQIASNRLLHWTLSLTLLGMSVVVGAHWLREAQEATNVPKTFALDTSSFRAFPYIRAEQPIPDSLRYRVSSYRQETRFIALDTGKTRVMAGLDEWGEFPVYPHDTIDFTHLAGLRFAVPVGFRALVLQDSDTMVSHLTQDSSVAWYCAPDEVAPDTSESDTLGTKPKG